MTLEFELPPVQQPIPDHANKVFSGEIFTVYQWEQELFDGSTATFEKLKRADTIGVIPVTEDNKIVVTRQEQPGLLPFYSLAGGRIDQGETVEEAALRELREETGMKPKILKPWFALRPLAKIDWTIYVVIAQGCKRVGQLQLDGGEKITTEKLNFAEFVELSRHPEFRDLEIQLRLYQAEAVGELDDIKTLLIG